MSRGTGCRRSSSHWAQVDFLRNSFCYASLDVRHPRQDPALDRFADTSERYEACYPANVWPWETTCAKGLSSYSCEALRTNFLPVSGSGRSADLDESVVTRYGWRE